MIGLFVLLYNISFYERKKIEVSTTVSNIFVDNTFDSHLSNVIN